MNLGGGDTLVAVARNAEEDAEKEGLRRTIVTSPWQMRLPDKHVRTSRLCMGNINGMLL